MAETAPYPIVIDLGKIKAAEVERLRDGSGQIVDDVKEVMRLLNEKNLRSDTHRVFIPVVTLYRKET